ncbi:MAG: efflux RND transporter periplasmic adaptor subunit [Verrucomicrobia bacterium]|nr:efflux RND transporter periplasmic adaptor subunit [Verrucomicrobiota bacterium]
MNASASNAQTDQRAADAGSPPGVSGHGVAGQEPRSSLRGRKHLRTALKVFLFVAAGLAFIRFVALKPVPVQTHKVARGPLVAEVMGTGTLEAHLKATISPKIQGRLAQVLVDQNDSVRTGQLLALLDDAELKQQVEIANAALAAGRATVERVRADEARARAVATQARLDHTRISELLTTKVASQSDLDKATEQLHVAEADLKRAQFAITEAERQVLTAEQTLLYQRERLADTRIVSPLDGLVVRRDRDPGDVVVPGSAILQVISTNELWISAWVDETAMAGLAPDQPARVVFRSAQDKTFPGAVARLGRQTDPETREFIVDVRVKELPANWAVGQRAEVFITTGHKDSALAVPSRAIQWREGQAGVFAAERGKVRWRPVSLGLRGRESVEVTSGLTAEDIIVTARDPKRPLREGRRVALP